MNTDVLFYSIDECHFEPILLLLVSLMAIFHGRKFSAILNWISQTICGYLFVVYIQLVCKESLVLEKFYHSELLTVILLKLCMLYLTFIMCEEEKGYVFFKLD